VNEDVGHTVVHFLCTGNYETLRTASEPGASKMEIEFRRSMLVYQAAREYDLYDLETYAKKYIEVFGESMSSFIYSSLIQLMAGKILASIMRFIVNNAPFNFSSNQFHSIGLKSFATDLSTDVASLL
jgi:hypothetical protein